MPAADYYQGTQPVTEATQPDIASWRRGLAYWWYAWGLSWCYWGVRMSSQSFFRAGMRSFDRALRLWPAFAQPYYRRGLIRGRELNQHAAAIDDMGRAIAIDPQWPEPYLQRGLFQRFHGDPHAALADLRQYVELSDDAFWRGEAERQIGMIVAELGQDPAR
jgi:tetratricopeptide (TPR) repeat protein